MEDDFNTIMRMVEELDPTNLAQDRVTGVVGHVMCRYWWESIALESKNTALKKDLILLREELF